MENVAKPDLTEEKQEQTAEILLRKEIAQIRDEIQQREQILEDKEQLLLLIGIAELLKIPLNDIKRTISDFMVEINEEDQSWTISYTHTTDNYTPSYYAYHSDSETEDEPVVKSTEITFGKDKKYYIDGGVADILIYKNSDGMLRIINQDYSSDIDINEQKQLTDKYIANDDIAEWLALKIFMHMCNKNISDIDMIKYLSIYM